MAVNIRNRASRSGVVHVKLLIWSRYLELAGWVTFGRCTNPLALGLL